MRPFFRSFQIEFCPPDDHYVTVFDKILKHFLEVENLWNSFYKRQKVHTECPLHLGVLEQQIENNLRICVSFQFDINAHAVPVGFVPDVVDSDYLFISC